MVETMRREGHEALVHTAAASTLGQMLQRLCGEEKIALVNIVRRVEQVELLRSLGAAHVCDSHVETFVDDLTGALEASSATLAFDAVGGGRLASQILQCMESAAMRAPSASSRTTSARYKKVYVYGYLDRGSIEIARGFGAAWGVGGWLLGDELKNIAPIEMGRLRERIANSITTTFATTYAREISLSEALDIEVIRMYGRQATGLKFLLNPTR
jgi:hypothetical protein